ncbi:hypothetical protein TNCV_2573251 [Trichonephila clavipes]|nr:hypothetical protein TNCV_2573251 [Trichonephila clavipes]
MEKYDDRGCVTYIEKSHFKLCPEDNLIRDWKRPGYGGDRILITVYPQGTPKEQYGLGSHLLCENATLLEERQNPEP